MRHKKILLVAPGSYEGRHRLSCHPPAGLGYVAESLRTSGFGVDVFDMNLRRDYGDLRRKVRDLRPDIIGFTIMTFGYKNVYSLIGKIKKEYPEIRIVAGGPHVSTLKDSVLRDCSGIDYGVILEGDLSIIELCGDRDPKDINGFIYREGEKVVVNDFDKFIKDLDGLPFPKYESFELSRYPVKQIGIVTSRGCPYSCIYCPVSSAIGRVFRWRSARSVVDEIAYFYGRGYRTFLVLDDNFTLLRDRVEEICELIIARGLSPISLKCPNGIRADKVDRDLLRTMRRAGFDMIAFGVESGSDRVLRNIKKGEDIVTIEKNIRDACDLGFDVDLFFIIGSPYETPEDVRKSFSLAARYPVRNSAFYNIVPFPSTELFGWIRDNKYFIHPVETIMNSASHYINEPCFFTPEMTIEDRKAAFCEGKTVSKEIRRRYLERKLGGPSLFRRFFSWAYTLPLTERALSGSSLFIRLKENAKSARASFSRHIFTKRAKTAAYLLVHDPRRLLRLLSARIRPLPRSPVRGKVGGVVFEFDLRYDPQIRSMYNGIYEMDTVGTMKKLLKKGDIFIDVGANIGYISAVAAGLVGTSGEVHSFEPVPEYFRKLENLASINGKYKITANRYALSDRQGTIDMAVTNLRNIGWNTAVPRYMSGETLKETVEVPTCRLDSYIGQKGLGDISLIKIDTEGFEFPVLKGLSDYFEKTGLRPMIICEIAPAAYPLLGCALEELVIYMSRYGYRAFSLSDFGRKMDIARFDTTENVIWKTGPA